ncbi:Cyclic peptide synthetase, partial [Pyrenophora tritici-repentis]
PESIGLDDNFFQMGGDSISAMKLAAEAGKRGLDLTVADVFQYPQLDALTKKTIGTANAIAGAIPQVAGSGPVEQSFAQGRLWFLEELRPGMTWYIMPMATRIKGPLQIDALAAALQAIERRHDSLRTIFSTRDGSGMQEIQPFHAKTLDIIEIPLGNEQRLADALHRDQTTPFDLRTEPGWRVSVYRIGSDEHVLSIVMHHIISDGWSLDVLYRELAAFYSTALRGQEPLSQIQPLPIQYRDFAVWQKQPEQIDKYEQQLDYWVEQLRTSRPAELFCDKARPAVLSGLADSRQVKVEGGLYAKLQQFCKERAMTPFTVLLAAFRAAHYRLSGQNDATIGAPNAGRSRWETKDLIGFFVNMQCLRIQIQDETFEELVQQVHQTVTTSLAHQDVPFESIVSKLQKSRDLSRNPIVQISFAVHAQGNLTQLQLDGVQTETSMSAVTTRFDLEMHLFPGANGLMGQVMFSTDLYAPETIENLISVFECTLQRCLDEPSTQMSSLPLLDDRSYSQLQHMGLLQPDETPYPRDSTIVDLFRQQVAACPDRIAVVDRSEEMTYARLDELSDMMAGWLSTKLLAAESLVGVFANRSCLTIVALLGILKANLAYLPLHTSTPAARMAAIFSTVQGRKLVLVGEDVDLPALEMGGVEFARIGEVLDVVGKQGPASLSPGAAAQPSATSLAYVMFTSGSTGQPKGVMIEHRSIVRLVKSSKLAQMLPAKSVMAHLSNLAFDASTWEIYGALLNSGTLICDSYANGVPIGRAISNSGAFVMDSQLRLVPLGVIGELVVTGDGLARGYIDPKQNVDRFVSITVGNRQVRAYRTGDYVRCRPTDGQLEFFGRIDGQVKIRGHRIEVGEIENVLHKHRAVRDAVAVAQRIDDDEAQLNGFITIHDEEEQKDDETQEHVDVWEARFDRDTYSSINSVEPQSVGRDFVGWTSMYDGSDIPKNEMNEWLDDTMRTIHDSGRARNVLEVGAGSGMILFNLGDSMQSYVGLDPSETAVAFVAKTARSVPALADKVRIFKATAADIGQLEESIVPDMAVVNSVVQYFPSQDYLFQVVKQLLELNQIETLFFGDVRSYALHRDFLATRAVRMAGNGASKADIRNMVANMEQAEMELLVDPAFFTSLPGRLPHVVDHVEILPKKMKATNELSSYRYAAVIHVKPQGRARRHVREVGDDEWIDFVEQGLDREALVAMLETASCSPVTAVSNIPNSKTVFSRCLVDSLQSDTESEVDERSWMSRVEQAAKQLPSLSATDLGEIAQAVGCRVEVSWSRQHSQRGGLDAIFHREPLEAGHERAMFRFPSDHDGRPQQSLSSSPLRQQRLRTIQQQLREMLQAQLPPYMVPQSITVLDTMPVNENGKIDRKALARARPTRAAISRDVRAPVSEAERQMQ